MVCDLACDFQELDDIVAENKESRLCLRTTSCRNVRTGLLIHVTAKEGGICESNVGKSSPWHPPSDLSHEMICCTTSSGKVP